MEADVLIMNENSDITDDKIDYPGTVNGRCVRVAHMYLFGRDHIRRALGIAGLRKLNVSSKNELRVYLFGINGYFNSFQRWVKLDGVLFHNDMQQYSDNDEMLQIARKNIQAFCVDSFDL